MVARVYNGTPTSGSDLADTGVDRIGPTLAIGGLALLAGAGLVVAGRKRRTH